MLATSTGALLLSLMVCTWLQAGHWRNSIALFTHTLGVTANNYLAHNNLGNALAEQGKYEEAFSHHSQALEVNPSDGKAHHNLGILLTQQGKQDEAIAHYREAIRLDPEYLKPYNNLAWMRATHWPWGALVGSVAVS